MADALPIFMNSHLIFYHFHLDLNPSLSFHHHHYHFHYSYFLNGLIVSFASYFHRYSDYQTYYSYPLKIDQFHLYFPLIIALFHPCHDSPFQLGVQSLGPLCHLYSFFIFADVYVSDLQKLHL